MAHVAQYKKDAVKKVVTLLKENPIIGIVDMENLPAPQLQHMKEKLRENVTILMTKKRLMKVAFEQVKKEKPGIEKLEEHFKGMPAIIFTKDNPFALFSTLKKNKSSAPAKAGQTAPNDIKVTAGPTNFAPGPIIGELGALGIKTGVENGKIAIKEDKIVAKEGDVITEKLAGMLTRLDIRPMQVGLDLRATYENGTIFTKSILDIDEEAFLANLTQAASNAYSFAIEISHITNDTIAPLLTKAYKEAFSLAIETVIVGKDTIKEILSKAEAQSLALKTRV